jgi:hypothetical protein
MTGPHDTSVYARVRLLCDQWSRTAPPLPSDALHLLNNLVKTIVLAAAEECDDRAKREGMPISLANEARKCAAQIRHNLLCAPGESVCILCDGEGCERCERKGVRRLSSCITEPSE